MSDNMPPPPTQRKSRVLAALDNPGFLSAVGYAPSLPITSTPTLPSVSYGLPPTSQTPIVKHYAPPAAAVAHLSAGLKRKASGLENDDDFYGGSAPIHPNPFSMPSSIRSDFNLNYDRESALTRLDIGGDDQHAKMAEFVSRGIDNAAYGLTVDKAVIKLGLEDAKDLIPGMEVRLLPHQLIGVSWMVDQERDSPHKGGILADDMGLGKTVQMIATMVINQPSDDEQRSNLIVVPAALLLQWKEELETKTNGMFEVHIQHGKSKIRSAEKLAEKDVVITTYHTLNLDFGIPSDLEGGEEMRYLQDYGGPLSQVKWFRVILDESQFIRNRATRCSKAVAMLRTRYRWCLTGTPITNTLADIYGYLRFGRFRPWNDWTAFNNHIAKVQLEDALLAGMRAQEVLKPILLRRTKDAKLENGEPILQLPPKDVELVYLDFSKDERELYDVFEKRAQIQINRFIRNHTLLKNHQQIFVLILRLRQVCAHPYLVLSESLGFDDPSLLVGSESEKEVGRATKAMGARWVANIQQRFLERARDMEMLSDDMDDEPSVCPKCGDLFLENNGRILACGHEVCADCIEALATSNIQHNGEFGNNDEKTNLQIEKDFEVAAAKGLRPCPTPKCGKMQDLRPNAIFLSSAFLPTEGEVRAAIRAAKSKRLERARIPPAKRVKVQREVVIPSSESESDSEDDLPDLSALLRSSPSKGKGSASVKKEIVKGEPIDKVKIKTAESESDDMEGDSSTESDVPTRKQKVEMKGDVKAPAARSGVPQEPDINILKTWREGGRNVEASAKMLQMVAYLKEWESLGDKTIIFSQWTSMLDLCEQIFARHGIRSLRYDGQMSHEAREFCLKEYRQPGGAKIVLVSIKCGGVGLNLVSANRVINLDLSWNYAVESQAYDRVHRLGQEKSVYIKRLIVRDTIEERMLKLQETKLGLAEAALGEGNGVRLQKLSVRQIKDLFGMNKRANQDNQTQIV